VVEKVLHQGEEELYVVESQREELMKKKIDIKEILESLQINVT